MSQQVKRGGTYQTMGARGEFVTATNPYSHTIYVCDCHGDRVVFSSDSAAYVHEDANSPAPWQPHGPNGTYNERV